MKILIIAVSILLTGCANMGDPYLKVGVGYKFHETELGRMVDCNKKFTGRVQLGYELGPVTYGIEHLSDLQCAKPFREGVEYTNDQVFIDYKFNL